MNPNLQGEIQEQQIKVTVGTIELTGELVIPENAQGLVLFAHTSSNRLSTRNRYMAHVLRLAGLATLLINLLSPAEESMNVRSRESHFDIEPLTARLVQITDWLAHNANTAHLKVGYFGDGTAAGAAIVAATEHPTVVGAIVSRNGRPDLAEASLAYVQAPTLLIVGGNDTALVANNSTAFAKISTVKKLEIIADATHLFEEPGILDTVAQLASHWFRQYLGSQNSLDFSSPALPTV